MNIDTTKIDKELEKLHRKDPVRFNAVIKKISQIGSLDIVSIEHLKNLKYGLSDFKRVQVGSFVLFFRVEGNTVIFELFEHHDDAYSR